MLYWQVSCYHYVMPTLTNLLIDKQLTDRVLTDTDLGNILSISASARYALVNKALKKQELIKIRRGLYILAEKYRRKKISAFYLANRIVPQSYISLESALSFHGWIPERVSTVRSILPVGRRKTFINSFGEFAYYQLPTNPFEFLTSVSRIEEIQGEPFLIASPLRALADLFYINDIDWKDLNYLTEGLRIDKELLMTIKLSELNAVKKIYRSKRVLDFISNLRLEINNG